MYWVRYTQNLCAKPLSLPCEALHAAGIPVQSVETTLLLREIHFLGIEFLYTSAVLSVGWNEPGMELFAASK